MPLNRESISGKEAEGGGEAGCCTEARGCTVLSADYLLNQSSYF
jgi:hypothetical protein